MKLLFIVVPLAASLLLCLYLVSISVIGGGRAASRKSGAGGTADLDTVPEKDRTEDCGKNIFDDSTDRCPESGLPECRRDETIKHVYVRMEDYFSRSKPYLDGSISIESVARHLYTNKVYVSRAVNKYSGLNFCQYVNRYRIYHAMELYRRNPALRMTELAQMSGFNSVASFNISFRAFMNESPGSWSRRFRLKLQDDTGA